MTRVKICGCTKVADAVAAAEAGADFIGINFAPTSRRRVPREEAALIVLAIGMPLRDLEQDDPPPTHPGRFDTAEAWFAHGAAALDRLLARKSPLVVGVFANQDIEEVNDIANETGLDLIQLSGDEPWTDALLASRQVIKAVPDASSLIEPGAALAVMLDPSRGTATIADREKAAEIAARFPMWLAGGLTPQNVAETILAVRPWLVDVASGVETDGLKDPEKIARFVRAAREA